MLCILVSFMQTRFQFFRVTLFEEYQCIHANKNLPQYLLKHYRYSRAPVGTGYLISFDKSIIYLHQKRKNLKDIFRFI